MKSRPDGDSKIQEVRRRSQNLCSQDLVEPKKQEVEQKVKAIEERWTDVMHSAKQALDHAERKCALENQLRSFKDVSDTTTAWLQDKQQSLDALDVQSDPERKISAAQVSQDKTHFTQFSFILCLIYIICCIPVNVPVLSPNHLPSDGSQL